MLRSDVLVQYMICTTCVYTHAHKDAHKIQWIKYFITNGFCFSNGSFALNKTYIFISLYRYSRKTYLYIALELMWYHILIRTAPKPVTCKFFHYAITFLQRPIEYGLRAAQLLSLYAMHSQSQQDSCNTRAQSSFSFVVAACIMTRIGIHKIPCVPVSLWCSRASRPLHPSAFSWHRSVVNTQDSFSVTDAALPPHTFKQTTCINRGLPLCHQSFLHNKITVSNVNVIIITIFYKNYQYSIVRSLSITCCVYAGPGQLQTATVFTQSIYTKRDSDVRPAALQVYILCDSYFQLNIDISTSKMH